MWVTPTPSLVSCVLLGKDLTPQALVSPTQEVIVRNKCKVPIVYQGFPYSSVGKEFACNTGDLGWEDSLEEGKATHSSSLAWRIPMDRGA